MIVIKQVCVNSCEAEYMRINQVQGITFNPNISKNNYQTKDSSSSVLNTQNMTAMPDFGYGRDLVHRKTSFTGSEINKAAIELAKQLPLEDRLASLFQVMQHGDFVLLGADFNKAQLALKKNLSKLRQAIRKEIFLPDGNIRSNFGFIKNISGDIEILNINDKNLSLITGGRTYKLEPGNSFYVINNDTVQYADDVLHIKDKPKVDLSFSRPIFSQVLDFDKEVQESLAKLNERTVAKQISRVQGAPAKITFADIGGQDKAIEELKKGILFPIRYPSAYTGDDITRGFILHGPAGTGKTALCRALANESDANYNYISGTSFQNKYVGESEANVRAFFDELKQNQPSIGVIDEIDAVGAERGDNDVYGAKLVDQILTCMTDIYDSNDNVFILGLTNKYSALDNALRRAERFSKHILIGEPDRAGVDAILRIHTKNKPLDKDINFDELVDKIYEAKAVGGDIKYMTKLARENMMKRLGIYEKMENGTFKESDMKNAGITQEDFLAAIADFKSQHRANGRKPIGFGK